MSYLKFLVATLAATTVAASSCHPFPSSMVEFSVNFKEPKPPRVKPEFGTNFVQHKWYDSANLRFVGPHSLSNRNQNLSHITTGYITNSPSQGVVRAVEAFDGNMASSLFNYKNVTQDGLVDNTMITYHPNSTEPEVWRGYVNSGFPLFSEDILIQGGAVFVGLVQRQFVDRRVAAV